MCGRLKPRAFGDGQRFGENVISLPVEIILWNNVSLALKLFEVDVATKRHSAPLPPTAQQIQRLSNLDSHFTHSSVNRSQCATQCGACTACRAPQYGHSTVIQPRGNEQLRH